MSQPPPPQTRTPCGELGLGLRDTSVVGGSGPAVGGRSGSPQPARAPARSSGAELREGAVPVPRGAWSAAASPPAPEGGRCAVHSRPQRGARPVCHAVAAPGGGGPLPVSPSLPTGREGPRPPGDAHARLFPSLAPAPAGGLALAEGASVPLSRGSRRFLRGTAWGPRHRPTELGEAFPGLACGVPSARPFLQGRLLCDSARGGDRLCPERPRGAQGAWCPLGTLAGPRVTPPLSGRRPDGHLHDAPPGRGGGAERPRGRPAAGRAPVLRPSRPPDRGLRPGAPPDAQQTGEGPTQGPWAGAVLPGRGTSVTVTLRTRDPDPPKSVTDPPGPPPCGSREPVGREAWCPRRAPGLSTRGSRVQPREEPAVGTGARSRGEGGACGASGPGAAVAVWAEASVCRNAGATLTPRGRA